MKRKSKSIEIAVGGGPHLAMAFLCEKVLQESDGVQSFIRIVDRFTIPIIPENVQLPPGVTLNQTIQCNLVITFKAGSISTGKYRAGVQLVKPGGELTPIQHFDMFFPGDNETGVSAVMPV